MEVKRDSWLKRMWRLFYPLLLHSVISFVVQVLFSLVMTLQAIADTGLGNLTSTEQAQLLINQIFEQYLGVSYYVTVLSAVFTIPFLYLFYRSDRKKNKALGTEVAYNKASAVEYILVGIVAFGACIGGNNLIMGSGLMEVDEAYQQVAELLYSAPLWIQLIGTGILVPLCEELIFRGLVYNRMKEYSPKATAMFLSALFFGLYHGNMIQMIYATALGYLMVYAYEKYHSFLAPFLFHAVANVFSVLISETSWFDFMYTNKMMMLLSGIMGCVIVFIGVKLMRDTVHVEPKDPASKIEWE